LGVDNLLHGSSYALKDVQEKFREARVVDCVQHYARWDLGQENTSVTVAVSEEEEVSCIVSLLRAENDLRAEVRELRTALETVDKCLVASEERARKAEERGDLLERAYSVLENDAHVRKRSRLD
jgi:predicted ribosome quality control (RQC) complex YloA/Tae2 family protein